MSETISRRDRTLPGLAARVIVLTLGLIAQAHASAAEPQWQHLRYEECRVFYTEPYEADARKVLGWIDQVRNIPGRFLGVADPLAVDIYLYPPDAWMRRPYEAYAEPSGRSLHFLSPSAPNARGDDVWYFKNLVHEYSHVVIAAVMGAKQRGFQKLPSWFEEALAEYISVMKGGPNVQAAYRRYLIEMQELVTSGGTTFLFRGDVYAWGVFTIQFIIDEFGNERLLSLLNSPSESFPDAMATTLGVDGLGFESRWTKWLPKYIAAVNWPVSSYPTGKGGSQDTGATASAVLTKVLTAGYKQRFRVESPSFLMRSGSGRPYVVIFVGAKAAFTKDELSQVIEGDGLLEKSVFASRDEVRSGQSQWASENFAGLVRVRVPVTQQDGEWVSSIPITVRPLPGVELYMCDVKGRWHQTGLAWHSQ